MRIAITSDIHFFPQWHKDVVQLARTLRAAEPDLLILAGDTGEPLDMFMQGLMTFKPVCEDRAVIAGNHDIWHRSMPHTSQRLWESLLGETAELHGYTWLEHSNLIAGGLGICGTLAWYDYGGRPDWFNFDDNFYEAIKPEVSNDGAYIDWPWTDREFAQFVGTRFEERLDVLEKDPAVRDVLVVTHVPLYRECVKPITTPEQALINAYYANVGLGKRVMARDKVRTVVSGHVHQDRRLTLRRSNGNRSHNGNGALKVYTVPSDYGHPAALLLDTDTWAVDVIRGGVS